MFTGLIEEVGEIINIEQKNGAKVFTLGANFSWELKIGESVAVNGACQSVISNTRNTFSVFCMKESLRRTNLDYLKIGNKVNLERAMILGQRLDGHIVQGHIDDIGKIKEIKEECGAKVFEIEYDTKYIIEKGSVALNGISLTISKVGKNSFCVSIIPQTLEKTNLKFLKSGDFVNIENDMFAKYVEKFLSAKDNKKEKISLEFLRENGF